MQNWSAAGRGRQRFGRFSHKIVAQAQAGVHWKRYHRGGGRRGPARV